MNIQDITLRLTEPVYFQTTNNVEENIKQLQKPIKVAPSNNYVFPKGYTLDDMLSDAKGFIKQDNANAGVFLGYTEIFAEAEITVTDASQYLDKAKQVYIEMRDYLNQKCEEDEIYGETIQEIEFHDRVFHMERSYITLRDSWRISESTLSSGFVINGIHTPYTIKFNLKKSEDTLCEIEHIEKFYEATKAVYSKLLE